eukprot:COSAG05_NODE_17796_length_319_cov_0.645455_2_plen_53_part_01
MGPAYTRVPARTAGLRKPPADLAMSALNRLLTAGKLTDDYVVQKHLGSGAFSE